MYFTREDIEILDRLFRTHVDFDAFYQFEYMYLRACIRAREQNPTYIISYEAHEELKQFQKDLENMRLGLFKNYD